MSLAFVTWSLGHEQTKILGSFFVVVFFSFFFLFLFYSYPGKHLKMGFWMLLGCTGLTDLIAIVFLLSVVSKVLPLCCLDTFMK